MSCWPTLHQWSPKGVCMVCGINFRQVIHDLTVERDGLSEQLCEVDERLVELRHAMKKTDSAISERGSRD